MVAGSGGSESAGISSVGRFVVLVLFVVGRDWLDDGLEWPALLPLFCDGFEFDWFDCWAGFSLRQPNQLGRSERPWVDEFSTYSVDAGEAGEIVYRPRAAAGSIPSRDQPGRNSDPEPGVVAGPL